MSPQKKLLSSAKFTISISWSPVLNLAIVIEMCDDLGYKNIQKHGELAVLQSYLHDKGKGVR